LQAKHTCKGWEEVTQSIVGDKPKKKIRIDDFMSKYTDFEVARRAMKYFSKFAGKDCVLTGKELQTGIQQTFGHGVSKDQVKAIIAKYSKDKDPKVSFQEFFAMYKDYEKSNSEDVNNGKGSVDEKGTLTDKESGLAEKAWNAMDTSKDGFIENHEFSSFFQGVVENMGKKGKEKKELRSQLKEYFKYFAGKDGKLSHVEYLRMMEVLKSKAGTEDFDKFLDALTASNCSELWDCYRCTAAKLNCAWVPAFVGGEDYDGRCVEQKAMRFFQSQLLRGAGLPGGNSFTKLSECGKKYDRPAFSGITTIAHVQG